MAARVKIVQIFKTSNGREKEEKEEKEKLDISVQKNELFLLGKHWSARDDLLLPFIFK